MLVVSDLANVIKDSLGFTSFVTSSQTTGLAQAIITALTTEAKVNNAIGTVMGTAPSSGGPLIGGLASEGTITGLTGSNLAALMEANMGFSSITPQLSGMANAIATHISTAMISFSLITGTCTNTPLSPGTLTGQGMGGTLSGLSGPTLAGLLASDMGFGSVSTQLLSFAGALVTYITDNATVTYVSGTITGVCSAGGGPITDGMGVGGTIS